MSVGVFINYDLGSRLMARFDSITTNGSTVTTSRLSGSYNELWLGPLIRLKYKQAHLELGYAPIGYRDDEISRFARCQYGK